MDDRGPAVIKKRAEALSETDIVKNEKNALSPGKKR